MVARQADAVIVKSVAMAKVLAPLEVHVIPNGVDTDLFRPLDRQASRAQLGWPAERHIVVFPNNPALPVKDFPLAQRVVEQASRRIGKPIDLMPLWGIEPTAMPLYFNAADAILMTSIAEGSPNAVKEALACDAAIVATAVGDIAMQLSGVEGCFAGPRSAETLGEALGAILRNRPAPNGRAALINRGLDLDTVARRVLTVYQDVVR
jgi:glycosyltransferase involved in cell wall biosynthesis